MHIENLPDCLFMIQLLVLLLKAVFAFKQSPKHRKDVAVFIIKLVWIVIKIALYVV